MKQSNKKIIKQEGEVVTQQERETISRGIANIYIDIIKNNEKWVSPFSSILAPLPGCHIDDDYQEWEGGPYEVRYYHLTSISKSMQEVVDKINEISELSGIAHEKTLNHIRTRRALRKI